MSEIRLIAKPGAGAIQMAAIIAEHFAVAGKRVVWFSVEAAGADRWLHPMVELATRPDDVVDIQAVDLLIVDGLASDTIRFPAGAGRTLIIDAIPFPNVGLGAPEEMANVHGAGSRRSRVGAGRIRGNSEPRRVGLGGPASRVAQHLQQRIPNSGSDARESVRPR